MTNGLLPDIDHYKLEGYLFTIGRYHAETDHPIRDQRKTDENNDKIIFYSPTYEFRLFSAQYQTLFYTGIKGYLDGDVIDSFAVVKERQWTNAVAFPSQQSKIILVNANKEFPISNWSMYHIKKNISGLILFPYEKNKHWCLFVVDVNRKLTWHLDPMFIEEKISERSRECFKNFQTYLKISRQIEENSLNTTTWTNTRCPIKRKLQNNGFNCGVHVLHYMNCIGHGVSFDINFDPSKYRTEVAEMILKESESMTDICLFCYCRKANGGKITCKLFGRFAHINCLVREKITMVDICILCSEK